MITKRKGSSATVRTCSRNESNQLNSPSHVWLSGNVAQQQNVENLKALQELLAHGLDKVYIHHQLLDSEAHCQSVDLAEVLVVHLNIVVVDTLAVKPSVPRAQNLLCLSNPQEKLLYVHRWGVFDINRQFARSENAVVSLKSTLSAVGTVNATQLTDNRGIGRDPLETFGDHNLAAAGGDDSPAEAPPGR